MTRDKQLQSIRLARVLEKRRLGQALNMKEFAVLAGLSYSVAREWTQLPGFPRFQGVIFWQDFVDWKAEHNGSKALLQSADQKNPQTLASVAKEKSAAAFSLRAARIFLEAAK